MGKCIVCGKHGLFLKVDSQGRCEACASQIRREEEEQFNIYYGNMLRTLNELQEYISVGDDPIDALEYVPRFREKLELCDVLEQNIHDARFTDRLIERLISRITFRDDSMKRLGIGSINEWGISVIADHSTKQFVPSKILADLDKLIGKYRGQWKNAIISVENNAEYKRKLDSIPSREVLVTDTKHSKLATSELDDLVKYSSVTAKTSADRLGNFVVIDTETTGLSSAKDGLVEVAAVRFEDWEPVEKWQTMINPGKPIPKEATDVNGITDDMVADAPTFEQVIDSLSEFVGSSALIGHNLPFDLKFLYRGGYDFASQKRKYYDTCELAKKTLKQPKMKWDKEYEEYVINDNYPYDVENYKLVTLCDYYKLRDNIFAHRALSDAYSTGLLFERLVKERAGE